MTKKCLIFNRKHKILLPPCFGTIWPLNRLGSNLVCWTVYFLNNSSVSENIQHNYTVNLFKPFVFQTNKNFNFKVFKEENYFVTKKLDIFIRNYLIKYSTNIKLCSACVQALQTAILVYFICTGNFGIYKKFIVDLKIVTSEELENQDQFGASVTRELSSNHYKNHAIVIRLIGDVQNCSDIQS